MFKALKIEIKHSIFKTWFHTIRFLGLLIIPFMYGFSYIFAFYNPFSNVDKLDVVIVTHKGDLFANDLAKTISKKQELKIGETTTTMNIKHIYAPENDSPKNMLKLAKKHNAVIEIPKDFDKKLSTMILNITKMSSENIALISTPQYFLYLLTKLINSQGIINLYNNFQKNYILALGMNIISATNNMYGNSLKTFVETDTINITNKMREIAKKNPTEFPHINTYVQEYNKLITGLEKVKIENFVPLNIHSQMGNDKAKYGYGLAPFFICVAMWIGGMVMTFSVHRVRYDKSISAIKTYFAKYILIVFGNIIQATILMTSLYLIGFKNLGFYHWFTMYIFTIIISLIFSAIIQAIRFSIPSRNIGIFIVIIFLVLQLCSAGGLFPVATQNGFYRVIHKIMPFTFGANLLRELMFETNWINVIINILYLSIFLLYIPIGIYSYNRRLLNKGFFTSIFGRVEKYEEDHIKNEESGS